MSTPPTGAAHYDPENPAPIRLRFVAAGTGKADFEAAFLPCVVEMPSAGFENGDHHRLLEAFLERSALSADSSVVWFEEQVGPAWLFEHFDWAALTPLTGGRP